MFRKLYLILKAILTLLSCVVMCDYPSTCNTYYERPCCEHTMEYYTGKWMTWVLTSFYIYLLILAKVKNNLIDNLNRSFGIKTFSIAGIFFRLAYQLRFWLAGILCFKIATQWIEIKSGRKSDNFIWIWYVPALHVGHSQHMKWN